ncbi:MAG: hypothetical protein KA155_07175 [Alphaproteobacteria bacterium]|jgi:hypothetical protein|nr:hypothetical protein [Alphaproteobacteria bacterium]
MSTVILFNTAANPSKPKPPNPYDNSVPIELDWHHTETFNKQMEEAVKAMSEVLGLSQTENNNRHIKAFLTICARMQKYAPDKYVSYSRDNNSDTREELYNPYDYKLRKLRQIIDILDEQEWIENKLGISFPFYKRLSRFKASPALQRFIQMHELSSINFYKEPICGGIIVKDEAGKLILDYKEWDLIKEVKVMLQNYNKVMRQADIKLANGKTDFFFDRTTSYRVFNSARFDTGGRFYGPWWQNCSKEDRRFLTINGKPTIELDYKAHHLYLIYGLANLDMPEHLIEDPYKIDHAYPREIIKAIFTIAMNARDELSAWRAFRQELHFKEEWAAWKALGRDMDAYRKILHPLKTAHPVLTPLIHTGYGGQLMVWDSRIAECVLDNMTNKLGIPCLCIHDSFLVDIEHQETLKAHMLLAYEVVGLPKARPPIKATLSMLVN